MANLIPPDIATKDLVMLSPVVIQAALAHAEVNGPFMVPKMGQSWQAGLGKRDQTLTDRIKSLAGEELETRELVGQFQVIQVQLPRWKEHVLTVAELAYENNPKAEVYLKELGRGKQVRTDSLSSVRSYLEGVVPDVGAHRKALLAAGADAEVIDEGEQWVSQLKTLKEDTTREKTEDDDARTAVNTARTALLQSLNWSVRAANAAKYKHPEAEKTMAKALAEGYRKISSGGSGSGGSGSGP